MLIYVFLLPPLHHQPPPSYTLTTLSTGNKGAHTSPPPSPFPLPFKQDFDKETLNAPPYMWYDQMGAWQVSPRQGGSGNVMRQMSIVWPACWGYSCNAATTYFGPEIFNASTRYSVDVMAEDHVAFTLGLSKGASATVSTNGSWTVGKTSGNGISFDVNSWHTLTLEVQPNNATLSWDGKILATDTSASTKDGSHIAVWGGGTPLDRFHLKTHDAQSLCFPVLTIPFWPLYICAGATGPLCLHLYGQLFD